MEKKNNEIYIETNFGNLHKYVTEKMSDLEISTRER